MALVTVPSVGVIPAPIKAGRILRRAKVASVIWFARSVEGVNAVRMKEAVQSAGLAEECVGLGDGRAFVRATVCL